MLVVEVANGRSLVWGAEAVQALRERLGVGGRTVGALPRGPRQNSRLGLPLLLMPEEARLLAEIGAVTLVSAPRPDPRQHGLALASFKRQQEQSFQEQSALAGEAREARRQELLERIAEGQAAKKQKLEREAAAGQAQEGQASGEQDEAGDPLRFHAHYIAQCWAPDDPIPLQDLVSAGRLGTSVRKTVLLCSPQPDGKVVYTSLQWAGLQ